MRVKGNNKLTRYEIDSIVYATSTVSRLNSQRSSAKFMRDDMVENIKASKNLITYIVSRGKSKGFM